MRISERLGLSVLERRDFAHQSLTLGEQLSLLSLYSNLLLQVLLISIDSALELQCGVSENQAVSNFDLRITLSRGMEG